jgi:hypothetical protein
MVMNVYNKKLKFLSRFFNFGFCEVNKIRYIKVLDRRDHISIKFILKIIKDDQPFPLEYQSSFYKVWKK